MEARAFDEDEEEEREDLQDLTAQVRKLTARSFILVVAVVGAWGGCSFAGNFTARQSGRVAERLLNGTVKAE